MNKSTSLEVLLVSILVLLLGSLIDPFDISMGGMIYMSLVGVITGIYFIIVFFIWGEKPHDEREYEHRYASSRAAYLAGSAVLILGIVLQSFTQGINPWLPSTLAAMFVAKLVTRIYLEHYK